MLNIIIGLGSGIVGVIFGIIWNSIKTRPSIKKDVILTPKITSETPNFCYLTMTNVGNRNISQLAVSAFTILNDEVTHLLGEKNKIEIKATIAPQVPISFRFIRRIDDLIPNKGEKPIINLKIIYYDDFWPCKRKITENLKFTLDRNFYEHLNNAIKYDL